jgi:hypothetical protein
MAKAKKGTGKKTRKVKLPVGDPQPSQTCVSVPPGSAPGAIMWWDGFNWIVGPSPPGPGTWRPVYTVGSGPDWEAKP